MTYTESQSPFITAPTNLIVTLLLFLPATTSNAQDVAKRETESPVERLLQPVKPASNELKHADISKSFIESPAKQIITLHPNQSNKLRPQKASFAPPTTSPFATTPVETAFSAKVKPGIVQWHKDLDSACRHSKLSGKPVLHFQLLGKLDERFT